MAFKQNVALSVSDLSRDPHQMLLHELHRENREDAMKVDLIGGRPVDQRVGASDQYLILDGNERNKALSDIKAGVFVFDIQNGTGTGSEIIGVHDALHTISEIEFQSFPMPNIKVHFVQNLAYQYPGTPNVGICATFLTEQDVFYTQLLYPTLPVLVKIPAIPLPGDVIPIDQTSVNRFEIQIAETSLQSYADKCGFRHNFAFDIIYLNNQAYANPVSPVFVFTDPIVTISRLSITFFDAYRCSTLSFRPESLVNVRLGAIAGTPLSGGRVPYYLNLFFETNLPPFQFGNYIYISPTQPDGTPIISTYFDTRIFKFLTTCGINQKADQNYPLVTHNVAPVPIRSKDGVRYWVAESNPNIQYPVIQATSTNGPIAPMIPIKILTTLTEAQAYGFTTFDPTRNIILLVPNQALDWSNPNNLIRCVGVNSFLLRYGTTIEYTIKIASPTTAMYFAEDLLSPLIPVVPPPPPLIVQYAGFYMLKTPNVDIKKAPTANPFIDAIKLTSAKPFSNVKLTDDTNNFVRQALLPNIDEVTVCLPLNQLRLPVRIRRILRRVTQLGGL
tara:strand:+ start:3904 stop:5580 length:1677 start_codon:yes stop_codon:yes gene_type:complete